MKIKKKIILIVVVIVIVLSIVAWSFLTGNNGDGLVLEEVIKGMVVKEISETGTVKISEESNLSFKNTGRIEIIYVNVGDVIETGQILAKINTSELAIQLAEAQAALSVVKAKKVDAQVSLTSAKQNLEDTINKAGNSLNGAYEDALAILDDAYLKIYNAFKVVDSIKRDYYTSTDNEGINVVAKKNKISSDLDIIELYIDDAKIGSQEDIDIAISKVRQALLNTKEGLEVVRDMTETISYRSIVSSADKTLLDNQKSYINTVYISLIDDQQTIATTKVDNQADINDAKATVSALEVQLEGSLNGLYQAQIDQAEANVLLLKNKIYEATLRSPANGQITKIEKRKGETVSSAETIVSFLPSAPFQIEVDIYEEDVVNIEIGNSVVIDLVAFPDQSLKGSVVSIDPAEKLIDGIVYYEVTINFIETRKGIKSGMTADIVINVGEKNDVLIVSKKAVDKINGQRTVQIFKDGEIEERNIETGLEGNQFTEVISGLEQGEIVVVD